MTSADKTLVLAGAREARAIVSGLLRRGRNVVASLPEPERSFGPLPVPTRMGPFDTAQCLSEWMDKEAVSTVIDVSHAFDTVVSDMARRICQRAGRRYMRVLRPAWRQSPADDWIDVATIREAARAVPDTARVFSNTGWLSLPDYEVFRGARLFMRRTQPDHRDPPYKFVTFVHGTPPFSQSQEMSLFKELGVTHLICRNVGGGASRSKLFAARKCEIPVYMVARKPLAADCPVVETVSEALAWEAEG